MGITRTLSKAFGIHQTQRAGHLDSWFFRRWFAFVALLMPLFLLFLCLHSAADERDLINACEQIVIWDIVVYLAGGSAHEILKSRFGNLGSEEGRREVHPGSRPEGG
jgi:hypothetical protein